MSTLVEWTSDLARLACWVAVAVVVFGVVRRQRPDAWQRLRSWAIASIVFGIASTVGWRVFVAYVMSMQGSRLIRVQLTLTLIDTLSWVVSCVLLLRGIVAIARPAPPPPPVETPPYR